jgi:Zn-dependent peptidase ImmA (M78 family)
MPTSSNELARQVLQTHDRWTLPVDPFAIAKDEDIQLAPGYYGDGFDARIEYVPEVKRFVIYYRNEGQGRPRGRVNFSIAHELGHFFLPSHREQLLAGEMHNSVSDFRSTRRQEQEADDFAANLLMPRELFRAEVQRFRQRVCTLAEMSKLADQRLKTSITSTARRYCESDIEACSVVFSHEGIVRWAMHSQDMKAKNMKFVPANMTVPRGSKSEELWRHASSQSRAVSSEGVVSASIWFENPFADQLWEDVMFLGGTGFSITLLTPNEEDF